MQKASPIWEAFLLFMPKKGLEPLPLTGHAPQTCASANSATWASVETIGEKKYIGGTGICQASLGIIPRPNVPPTWFHEHFVPQELPRTKVHLKSTERRSTCSTTTTRNILVIAVTQSKLPGCHSHSLAEVLGESALVTKAMADRNRADALACLE
jgi:hypothetical protein